MNVLLRSRSTGIVLIAIAAALWGMDAWIRQPLAQSTDVATIVFGEHLVLVLCTLPFAAGALTAVFGLGWRYVLAAVVIGAGSSAVATILFTQAFVVGTDFVTPVVLQKVQPIVAVIAARIILGERVRPRFALYLGPALVGAWLMGVSDPLHPTVHGLKPMLYALGAAVLWALGTVLGRYLARMMRFEHVTTLRFLFGLPASLIALLLLGAPAFASGHDTFWIAVLALVTGLVALSLYYYGLQRTPAVAATLAELAFPVSAILVGYFKFGQTLTGWQWVGVGLTSLVVVLLPVRPVETYEIVPRACTGVITLCDVGPRDGLQNEPDVLAPGVRAELVTRLAGAGLRRIEAVSFVRDDRVPQMAGAEDVVAAADRGGAELSGLVLNERGYERFAATSLDRVNCTLAATEEFNRRNGNASLDEAVERVRAIVARATIPVTVTVSCAWGCPFEGEVDPGAVEALCERLEGADEIVLADTIGVGTPRRVRRLVERISIFGKPVGAHLHNTRNTGYASAWGALDGGATVLDASVGGLGGCPFSPNATGNVATEDLVWQLERDGVATGVDVDALVEIARWLAELLGRPLDGGVYRASPWP